MENNYPGSLKGQFLMSMPGMADPNFSKTVTCICEHTQEGAIGIVINRCHPSLSGRNIFDELSLEYIPEAGRLPIYLGGPVHINEIFIVHGPPFHWQGCIMITDNLAMSNTMDVLKAVSQGHGPLSALLAIGCAGWGPLQLEAEIKANAWLTCYADEDIIFNIAVENRWDKSIRKMGIDPALLSDTAGHA